MSLLLACNGNVDEAVKLHEFHKAARTVWSKLERSFTMKWHEWHRSSSLEGQRCDQRGSESKQERGIWLQAPITKAG